MPRYDPSSAPVTFSVNGNNAAKNTVATFARAGTYELEVTITNPSGRTTTSAVLVTVQKTATGVRFSQAGYTVETGLSIAPLAGVSVELSLDFGRMEQRGSTVTTTWERARTRSSR